MRGRSTPLAVVGAVLATAAGWALLDVEPVVEPPAPPPRAPAPAPRPPRVPLEAPPSLLIREPPTRPDGLDRTDPCAPVPGDSGRHRLYPIGDYLQRRWDELARPLAAHLDGTVGERLRTALHAAPRDAGAGAPDDDDARFASVASLAEGAWRAQRYEASLAYARDAIDLRPDDALGWVLASEAAQRLHEPDLSRAALRRAFALAPHEPEIAQATLRALQFTADVMGALAAADALLDVVQDAPTLHDRALLARRAHAFADGTRTTEGRVTVVAAPGVSEEAVARGLELATQAIRRVEAVLEAPTRRDLVVWIYRDSTSRDEATCGRPRSAAPFLPTTVAELADDVDELALALAAARGMRDGIVPLWLRCGIAQVALGPETDADRAAYAALAARDHWLPLADVVEACAGESGPREPSAACAPDDAALARAQARATVAWILDHGGASALRELPDDVFRIVRDPAARISAVTGTPFDEPTLLAFLAARAGSPAGAPVLLGSRRCPRRSPP